MAREAGHPYIPPLTPQHIHTRRDLDRGKEQLARKAGVSLKKKIEVPSVLSYSD